MNNFKDVIGHEKTIEHLKTTGKVIDPQTEQTYLFYKGLI